MKREVSETKVYKFNECLLCGSKNVERDLVGKISVISCLQCEFQRLENTDQFLEFGHWNTYFSRRQKEEKSATLIRDQQYIVDAETVIPHVEEGMSLLDVGCSSGKFCSILNSHARKLSFVGIDIDKSGIDYANVKNIILGKSKKSSPFWGGVMSVVAVHNFDQ